jgi:2-polyprenyl-6-methoxyphenol hydroxylase-like FAD-dependent oxidoreductase
MKIVCIGGGPAGLYFALLMKQLDPAHRITVVERNRPYDAFGWGVVFSDATMDNMRQWDAPTAAEIEQAFNHWDDIELRFKGRVIRSGGHGFVGIGRTKLLNILQARGEALGVELVFETEVDRDADHPDADLVIASDGINSRVRTRYAEVFRPDIVTRPNRYIWLGTHKLYDAFTFLFEKTEHGWFQAHVYKFDQNTTTFIVECPEHVWLAHGLDRADADRSIAFCERLFEGNLQGAKLMTNARHLRGSAWLNFQRVTCKQWSLHNGRSHVVLMGDAVHTAHFAVGSGTKLAIEDAIELTRQFKLHGDAPGRIPEVLQRYQALRRVDVLRLQNAAWNAMERFEVCGHRYCDQLEPEQFMYSMLTRSQRISHENLRLRDAKWLEGYEAWLAANDLKARMYEVYGLLQPTRRGEIRAVWDHSGMGLYPGDWPRTCRLLKNAGVSDLYVNVAGCAFAHYASAVLPRSRVFDEQGDQLAACLAAAKPLGLRVHAWLLCYSTEGATQDRLEVFRKRGWLLTGTDGAARPWLDPAVPDVQAYLTGAVREMAVNYKVDGVHLDFVRYPDFAASLGPTVKARFEKASGRRAADWPEDVKSGPLRAPFIRWRAEQVTDFVQASRKVMRRDAPGKLMTAAVFGKYPSCLDAVGQDWESWLNIGLVDYVAPMNYTEDLAKFNEWLGQQTRTRKQAMKIIAGIGVTAAESRLDAAQVIDQIQAARRAGCPGFALFDLDTTLRQEILPVLRMGTTAP